MQGNSFRAERSLHSPERVEEIRASSRAETRERRAPCRASAIQHGGALLKATGSPGGAPNQGVAPSHFSVLKSHGDDPEGWCGEGGGGRGEGSGWGTHVYLWRIHFDISQN